MIESIPTILKSLATGAAALKAAADWRAKTQGNVATFKTCLLIRGQPIQKINDELNNLL